MIAEVAWLIRHQRAIHETANAFRFMQARYGSMLAMLLGHTGREC